MAYDFPAGVQTWLWLAFFASLAVKMPMWPVHTWLPDAHVQAPTAGSVILAGVLLKLGGYGFLRFSLPMFPEASAQLIWLVFGLSMVAVVYTSLIALVQSDMKKLIAYSSVAHMAIVTIGLFAFNRQGIEGALIVMLSHGLVSGALFLCVGVIYDRLHTREIDRYGGLAINMPKYAILFMLFTMASIGLPGTSGFVGEFLSLAGIYEASSWVAFVCTTGIILGAAYMLYLYRRVVFGELTKDDVKAMPDLNPREWAVLAPLAAVALWMGVYPESFLAPMRADVTTVLARIERPNPAGDSLPTPGKPAARQGRAWRQSMNRAMHGRRTMMDYDLATFDGPARDCPLGRWARFADGRRMGWPSGFARGELGFGRRADRRGHRADRQRLLGRHGVRRPVSR